jgi:transposase
MSKTFRDWSLDQALLLTPSVHDFVPAGHLSRFIVALVTEELDLSAIMASYKGEKGQPPYHPAMMVALLLYAYAVGIYSSRRIARACAERVDFMAIVALDGPDFRTISEFRRRHLTALAGLFVQVLKLCERAGLVKLGHVALDGTKIKANASKHKTMSYERMKKREVELQAEVDGWLKAAEAADAAEDQAFGADKRGDEMPDWVADKQVRLAKIREAKAELEAEAKAKAAAEQATREKKKDDKPHPGRTAAPPSDAPEPKAQRNFTDPESRILKTKDGYIQGYNAQAAVDAEAQVIVAYTLSNNGSDQAQFAPLLDGIKTNLGRNPDEARPMPATARLPIFAP